MRKDHGRVRDTAAASIKHWGSELGCSVTAIRCCYRIVPAYMLLLHSLQDPMLGILGTQCCTQAALAAALAVAPCMLCSFTDPGRATFEKTEIAQVYVCHSPSYILFPVSALRMRSVHMQIRNRDRVPRLRRVAATIVDPVVRCFNYSLSPGGFR